MSQPTREEVETFLTALRYGMKVSHKPEFLIALAEGWLCHNKDKYNGTKKLLNAQITPTITTNSYQESQ